MEQVKFMPMTVAYLRVSTVDQNTEKFKSAVLEYCNQKDLGKVEFVEEIVSGKKNWKERGLGDIVEKMGPGSKLVVPELSRLARSIPQIHEIITELRNRKIDIHVIKENIFINGSGEMDMTTKIQVSMFAMVSDITKDFISMRTKEALHALKESGVQLGRPAGGRILDDRKDEIIEYLELGLNKTAISKILKVNINTLSRFMAEEKLN